MMTGVLAYLASHAAAIGATALLMWVTMRSNGTAPATASTTAPAAATSPPPAVAPAPSTNAAPTLLSMLAAQYPLASAIIGQAAPVVEQLAQQWLTGHLTGLVGTALPPTVQFPALAAVLSATHPAPAVAPAKA